MKRICVLAPLFCALAGFAWAQSQPPAAIDPQSRITLEVTRVNVLYTVSDKKGRFVTNLEKDDFDVAENKKVQKILEFTAESDLPLRLALLIDTSNSIRDRFKFEQEASIEFLNSLLRPTDKAMIVSFDTAAEMVSDLTNDQEKLIKAIRSLRPGGGTALYDAVFNACKERLSSLATATTIRAATPAIRRSRWPRRPTWWFTRSPPTSAASKRTAIRS
jgi:Ca-activated chloride channel homolog